MLRVPVVHEGLKACFVKENLNAHAPGFKGGATSYVIHEFFGLLSYC